MRQDCETIFQNLAVYFNENLPNVIKISSSSYVQKCDKYLQNKLLKKLPFFFKFCESGEISPNLVTLNLFANIKKDKHDANLAVLNARSVKRSSDPI